MYLDHMICIEVLANERRHELKKGVLTLFDFTSTSAFVDKYEYLFEDVVNAESNDCWRHRVERMIADVEESQGGCLSFTKRREREKQCIY